LVANDLFDRTEQNHLTPAFVIALLYCRYATELATTLRRGGFEAHTTSDLEKRKAGLLTKKEAQQQRNDPQITHTIADLAAIQLVTSCGTI